MSLSDFFFNASYRESLLPSKPSKPLKKRVLKSGDFVKVGIFTVVVDRILGEEFTGKIIKQDKNLYSSTNYVGTFHKFEKYHKLLKKNGK